MAASDLTGQITTALQKWSYDVADAVDKAGEECARGMVKDLRSSSPKRTGQYGKDWASKLYRNGGRGNKTFLVHNTKHYQLTHILEKGHKKGRGRAAAPAFPHIGKANEKWQKTFIEKCEEAPTK